MNPSTTLLDPPASAPTAPAPRPSRRAAAARLRAGVSMLAWLYLSLVVTLCGWIVVCMTALTWQPVVMRAPSATPAIQRGDVVMIARPPAQPLGAGATVVLRGDDGPPAARKILSVEDDGRYRLAGSSGSAGDLVSPDAILGVGRLVVPFVGLPAAWMGSGAVAPAGAWAALTLAAIMVTLPSGRRRRRSGRSP